ncbi:SEC-C domain-containing protein [Mycolicibacterium pyrenivorans]|uniref:SEC-C domain-containing protein n=1 Tax=Mycolicibacterium pyrenivorans TaxID=187102 RepID=UPI0021F2C676|nr:SEC-C domain-containing protein [Mycolicibacterium pyrenivorans]MCV7152097.1 SEC-C domain-containing protein [Mycolicibacterium pyrenivorans]
MAAHLDPIEALSTILIEHGPLRDDDIAHRLREVGVADPEDLLPQLLDEIDCPAAPLVDDRWVWLPALLAGRIFTHRVGAEELAHDVLIVTPDLDAITHLCEFEQYARLADGSPISVALPAFDENVLDERGVPPELVDDGGALVLPPGTLRDVGIVDGDLLGLRLTPEGLTLTRVTADPSPAAGAALAATLNPDEPVSFDSAVWTACAADPALFTDPAPPLSEIAEDHGLVRRGDLLAPAGFDADRWRFELDCEVLRRRYGLDEDDALAVRTLKAVYEQMSALMTMVPAGEDFADDADEDAVADDAPAPTLGGYRELVTEFGTELADPRLAEVLVAETLGRNPDGAPALGLFAETLEPQVPRRARVAFRWLRAVALERIGDIEAAERELLAAESMDTDWPLPLYDLARFASDRGDVERGLALLRRAGADPDDPLLAMLSSFRAEPRPDVGRNEPCWCGSGRKYKKCHLGREQLSLPERVGWLYAKAAQHALLSGWRDLIVELDYERHQYHDDPDETADPLLIDAALFEGGAFEDFLAVRGSLLPEDERLLAEQWLLVDRSLFEVEQVRPGHAVTVRDVRTGDIHEVLERTASRQLTAGQLICTRVLPAGGDTAQFFGGLEPVALHHRDALIALLDEGPDPVGLVAFLSRRFAPPTLANTEGDPLMICEAIIRVSDSAALQSALDDTYDRVEDAEPPQWFEHVTTHGMERIRATLVLDGETLRVETNSEERMDRVLAAVERLDPAMRILDGTRERVDDPRAMAARMPATARGAIEPDDPEIAALLDAMILDYEAKWLDESIPALDGHTPRQAADDPTRRPDLIRLLDSFPADAGRHGMNPDRLRTALGLL